MHFLLMVVRLVLSVLFPSSGDGLSLAARPDGRIEHVPHSPWDWLLGSRHHKESLKGGRKPKERAGAAASPSRRRHSQGR